MDLDDMRFRVFSLAKCLAPLTDTSAELRYVLIIRPGKHVFLEARSGCNPRSLQKQPY